MQHSLYTQHKNFPSFIRGYSLPIFKANETITNFTQYELSQEETNLLKVGLYFSIQPDKVQKSELFTTFQKIHRSFINNLTSEETNSPAKVQLSYLANSYFSNYKLSPHILRQHRLLRILRKNKDIVITTPNKRNGVVILDLKVQKPISDTSKFKKLDEDPTFKHETSLQEFLRKLKKKTFLKKMNIINYILLVLLLLVSMALLKYTKCPRVILFLTFFQLFHL